MNRTTAGTRRVLTNRRLVWLMLAAVTLGTLVLFVADNFVLIEIRLLVTRVRIRLAWALTAAFLFGGVSALALARLWRIWRD